MKNLILFVTLVASCGFTSASARETGPSTAAEAEVVKQPMLEEIDWRLLEYRADSGEMAPLPPDTVIDLRFSAGEMGGSAGCNRYFGSYTFGVGNQVTLGSEFGSTQMACAPEVMSQEQRFLTLLEQVTVVVRVKDQMMLKDQDLETLLAFAAVEPATLDNTRWQAAGINNGKGGVVSTATTALSTAVFADGQVSGNGGCNQFSATYEVDGGQIAIEPAMATRKFCVEPEGIMDQEQQFFQALAESQTYSLTAEKLELRDESGSLQVGFRPRGD